MVDKLRQAALVRRFLEMRRRVVIVRHWVVNHVHGLAHLAYFVGVWVEGHGTYALFAGNLAIFTLFALLASSEEA